MTRTKKYVINVTALVMAAIAVAGWTLRSGGPTAIEKANQHWVLSDSFAEFRNELEKRQIRDAAANAEAFRELLHIVKGIDSTMRCSRGHKEYCP